MAMAQIDRDLLTGQNVGKIFCCDGVNNYVNIEIIDEISKLLEI